VLDQKFTKRIQEPLNLKRHSVLILCGPSECGKSYFARECQAQLNKTGYVCSIISSDDCRRELLQRDEHKHAECMMPISGPAFELAYAKLKAYTTYPVNHDFIIFDSTALSSFSRGKIAKLAKENEYTSQIIMFDYDDESEYYKYTDADWLVDEHLKKFKREKPKGFSIVSRKMPIINVTEEAKRCKIEGDLVVIGDVHGCYDQLIELLNKLDALNDGNINKDKNIIFCGDIVDKGPESEKVVDFLMPQIIAGNCKMILGNHENYLIKRWAGAITNDTGLEHFDTHSYPDRYRAQLQEICLRSYSHILGDSCIISHSPTDIVNLGKDSRAKQMRNFRHSRFTKDELAGEIKRMSDQRNRYMPLHIFGHIEFPAPHKKNGMIGIDTGCVSGGKLTAVKVSGKNYNFISVDGHKT
jgi:predicted kinase